MQTSPSTTCALLTSLLASALLVLAPAVDAQWAQQHKLLPTDGLEGDAFGSDVDTDGARIVAGAPSADPAGSTSGSAYLFAAGSGAQQLELVPTGATDGDRFGASVAIDGDRVVVGAPGADGVGVDSGAVYVFDANTGTQLLELEAADADAGDQFGYDVAQDGGLLVVGSLGAAYLFDVTTGQELEQLLPTGGSTTLGLSGFGEAVDIDGDLVVVGARLENGLSGIAGAVYVYDATNGDQLHRLIASNGTAWAFFGACVALDGSVLAIGAPEAGPKGKHSGAAYVFDAASGQQDQYLFPADGHVFAKFGSSVAVDGEDVFIGSPQNHIGGLASSGSVYVYEADGSLQGKLTASDVAPNDDFGEALAVSASVLVSGAPGDDDLGSSSGSAYVFDADGVWQDLGGAKAGTNGLPGLTGQGTMVAGELVSLEVTDGLAFATAHLVMGLSELSAPFKGGTLVPNPDWIVTPFPLDATGGYLGQFSWPAGVPSGTASYYQFWISDFGASFDLAATNGLKGTAP
jgi:hypothetical protein